MGLLGPYQDVGESLLETRRVIIELPEASYAGTARLWSVSRGFSRLPSWLAWGKRWRSEVVLDRPIPMPDGEVWRDDDDRPRIDDAVFRLQGLVRSRRGGWLPAELLRAGGAGA